MIRRLAALLVVIAGVAGLSGGAWARASASGLRLGAHPDGVTRFVMDLSDSIAFKVRLQAGPDSAVIETDGLDFAAPPSFAKAMGAVAGVRYDESGGTGRLALKLHHPAEVKAAYVLSPREGMGWRLVLDLKETTREVFLAQAASAPALPPQAAAAPPPPPPPPQTAEVAKVVMVSPQADAAVVPAPAPVPAETMAEPPISVQAAQPPISVQAAQPPMPIPAPRPTVRNGGPMLSAPMPPPPERPADPAAGNTLPVTKVALPLPAPEPEPKAPRRGDGRPVIVIDPGHGGVDPGAIGVSGIYEKHITLAVARELAQQLTRTGRYHVHLTRDRDVFIPLRDRVAIARQSNADLFVSLHADVVKDPQIRGLSVYTLSQNASDAEAQALADKENKADLIAGIDLSHESTDVANILIDLAQRETMNRSASFASDIVDELGRETSLLSNTHRFAGFAVLKAPDVPAVLIEMGYLSNGSEERSLRQPEYRGKLARSIAHAVDHFFLQGQKARR